MVPAAGASMVLELGSIDSSTAPLVGGKAANLGEMLRRGMSVPGGFCLTTRAYREAVRIDDVLGELERVPAEDSRQLEVVAERAREAIRRTAVPREIRAQIIDAYSRLGTRTPVAVRSSASAEDLPHASFAGQQESYLNIVGEDALVDAVRSCWASLWTDRAVSYRVANGVGHQTVSLAVVVQRMVDAQVAGVLFTANPVTGTRTEMVVDANPGLGDVVVSGEVAPEHFVLGEGKPRGRGCLSGAQLDALRGAGRELQRHFGVPQDVEWAFDAEGVLRLLQSRPITTLFPVPETGRPGPRVYACTSLVQGVSQPLTPMGMSVMRMAAAAAWKLYGLGPVDPIDGPPGFVEAGGRMYGDITSLVGSKGVRKRLDWGLRATFGSSGGIERVLADPRFRAQPGLPFRLRSTGKVAWHYGVPALTGLVAALVNPEAARAWAFRMAADTERLVSAPSGMTTAQRLRFVETLLGKVLDVRMLHEVGIIYAALLAGAAASKLLGKASTRSEVKAVLRGMPHNVTTQMDLALWRLASEIGTDPSARDHVLNTPEAKLEEEYRQEELPRNIHRGLSQFLDRYGRRAVAEIDVGVPRWEEAPGPVFTALKNYLRTTDPELSPDRQFERAAQEAERVLDQLRHRLRRHRVRAWLARFLLHRARAVAGLRELPKFTILKGFAELREQLLLLGARAVEHGRLERAEDIMFLRFREARALFRETDQREVVRRRRAEHDREKRRQHVPLLLLSDGTEPEALSPPPRSAGDALVGTPASPGAVTGVARVIREPAGAHLEPGEILVAPSTDPGWTPLFLTAGALVTESGGPNAHGPTVAREYGIPAVVGVRGATWKIRSGQRISVNASAGTVTLQP